MRSSQGRKQNRIRRYNVNNCVAVSHPGATVSSTQQSGNFALLCAVHALRRPNTGQKKPVSGRCRKSSGNDGRQLTARSRFLRLLGIDSLSRQRMILPFCLRSAPACTTARVSGPACRIRSYALAHPCQNETQADRPMYDSGLR